MLEDSSHLPRDKPEDGIIEVAPEHMRNYHPKGRRLPALERNILKFRAFEMMLVLFHVESMKSFVLNAMRATYAERFASDTKNLYQKVWRTLVDDGIITEAESTAIQRLVDYRNMIAHELHQLTAELSRESFAEDFVSSTSRRRYDYEALRNVKRYRDKIIQGMRPSYVFPLSFKTVVFEASEKAYRQEMDCLRRRIRRQIRERKNEMVYLKGELEAAGDLLRQLMPFHPLNVTGNGTLSKRGVQVCFRLFSIGLSTMAVSYAMRVSYRAINCRRREWERLGRPDAQPAAVE